MSYTIGIDHGYGYVKTANSCMLSGVSEYASEPPFKRQCLMLDGKYYICGGERQGYKAKKTEDESYYILTLAAIAEELKARHTNNGSVTVAAGLPLEYFGSQKAEFREYLYRGGKRVKYTYEDVDYSVKIEDVQLFPQGYAIIARDLGSGKYDGMKVVVDVGSWTVDILPIQKRYPVQQRAESLPIGVITCIEQVQKEFRRAYGAEAEDSQIQAVMMREDSGLPEKYKKTAEDVIRSYANDILTQLRQKKYNLDLTPAVFCGGGASVVKNFADCPETAEFIEDIHANALGYEYLCKGMQQKKKQQKEG